MNSIFIMPGGCVVDSSSDSGLIAIGVSFVVFSLLIPVFCFWFFWYRHRNFPTDKTNDDKIGVKKDCSEVRDR